MPGVTYETPDGEQFHRETSIAPRESERVMIQADDFKGVFVVDEVEHHVQHGHVSALVILAEDRDGDQDG